MNIINFNKEMSGSNETRKIFEQIIKSIEVHLDRTDEEIADLCPFHLPKAIRKYMVFCYVSYLRGLATAFQYRIDEKVVITKEDRELFINAQGSTIRFTYRTGDNEVVTMSFLKGEHENELILTTIYIGTICVWGDIVKFAANNIVGGFKPEDFYTQEFLDKFVDGFKD